MRLPCEYCGTFVEADVFMRHAVMPCCAACRWIPASIGGLGLVLMVAVILVVVLT